MCYVSKKNLQTEKQKCTLPKGAYLCFPFPPVASRSSKSGNPALRAHPCSGDDGDILGFGENLPERSQICTLTHKSSEILQQLSVTALWQRLSMTTFTWAGSGHGLPAPGLSQKGKQVSSTGELAHNHQVMATGEEIPYYFLLTISLKGTVQYFGTDVIWWMELWPSIIKTFSKN